MKNALIDEAEKIRNYFLGKLNAADAEEIELRLIADPEFESIIIASENELVEDWLDGVLSEDEAKSFKENYLITADRGENIEVVALLREYSKAKARSAAAAARDETKSVSILDKIRGFFAGIPAMAYAAGILLVIGAAAAYIWLGSGTPNGSLQTEYAALNKQDLGDLDKFKAMPQIAVLPGSLRGSGSGVKIAADRSVFIRLALVELKDGQRFNVSLMRGQIVLLNFNSIRSYDINGNREIRLLIPSILLEKGTYQIKASPEDKPDSPVTYNFTVE